MLKDQVYNHPALTSQDAIGNVSMAQHHGLIRTTKEENKEKKLKKKESYKIYMIL